MNVEIMINVFMAANTQKACFAHSFNSIYLTIIYRLLRGFMADDIGKRK